jgi:hypothetical protein
MTRTITLVGTVITLLCVSALVADAQEAPSFRPMHVTLSGGLFLGGAYPVGDTTAGLRRNAPGAPPPFTLLRAESELERRVGGELRVALALTRALAIEAGGSYAAPQLGVTISADPELAAGVALSERVSQYAVDVSAVYQLPLSIGRRVRPYALGGGGYLRQLHEGRVLVETGSTMHAGGGVQYWLRGGRADSRSLGARGEIRYIRRVGAIEFEDKARSFPAVSILAFFTF